MLYYLLFWTILGFIFHFYIIFGTNLLTGGPAQNCFFCCFRVSKKRNNKRSPNGMKPLGTWFSQQTWSRRLGVAVKKEARRRRGRGARPEGAGAPPSLMRPSQLHRRTSSSYIYPYTPKTSRSITKPYFHCRNLLYPWDPMNCGFMIKFIYEKYLNLLWILLCVTKLSLEVSSNY